MRRFHLIRHEDASGTSGTGVIVEGCVFTDGAVAMRWLTQYKSTAFYDSIDDVIAIHGHEGRTVVVWRDKKLSKGERE